MAPKVHHGRSAMELDFPTLRKQLESLGLGASYYQAADEQVQGLAPKGEFCRALSRTNRHCQRFLTEVAREKLTDPAVHCRSCLPGAFTVAAPLDKSDPASTVVLGCFISKSLGASEELQRLASRLQLDHQALLDSAQRQTRHRAEQVQLLAEVLANIVAQHCTYHKEQSEQIESLSRNLAETYEELSFIYKLNDAMNVAADPQEYFRQAAEDLQELLGVRAILVGIFPEALGSAEKENIIIQSGALDQSKEEIVQELCPRILADGSSLVHKDPSHCSTYAGTDKQGRQMLLAPILRSERQLGIIVAIDPVRGRSFDNIDATRLSSVANSAAVFLENIRLYGGMRTLFLGSMRALTSSIDAKDPYTCGHSERVGLISKRLIELMEMPAAEADRIYLCGLMHDIGKIGVPETVLRKPGKLTVYEFEIIKRHPVVGAKIISRITEMKDLVPAVLHHHERIDGQGYPSGLSGEKIPFRARVLCVADCLDAMTSDRPYRKALPAKLAETEIFRAAGTQFDPELVEAVVKLNFPKYIVELREHKGGYIPEDIYEPMDAPLSGPPSEQ